MHTEIHGHVVAGIIGPNHQFYLAGMRHHRFEAETKPVRQTSVSLEIRDCLRLPGTLRLRHFEGDGYFVRIDVFAEFDSGGDQIVRQGAFPGAVRPGKYQEKGPLAQSAGLRLFE